MGEIEAVLFGNGPGGLVFSGRVELSEIPGDEEGPFNMDWPMDERVYEKPKVMTEVIPPSKKGRHRTFKCLVTFYTGEEVAFYFKEGRDTVEEDGENLPLKMGLIMTGDRGTPSDYYASLHL
ncbi:MAG: hypothetical protein UX02_C0001G0076 [Candidatus Moranbacteria bacterium GW2011_GWC1_45_18]|nr:MAG: hypothetical protein UT79_C0002G0321 [Candidatus Moranbacteria bacterium GW2011_GWC2_40_12]KKT34160.1 MAG: hypothetical protein UW19_C0001G0055 [Candidatus Moranbacteria bacterium GW2011_GWF2_44_10]KKU00628.1 MAG: hypothetical protein UX02_C0001G0076 [Candidatus Moranbacteria bacterium GW2011_GWC1_45_18]OGI35812.1 MAG: hypothetical protein A2407_01490 [Candidatus Moranbacteria bacterium RIFOXYC1_FULL_44_8]OGI39133.1 MAG: hypothetical protein A2374_05145 [Candidatus Moranbacteria bacteri